MDQILKLPEQTIAERQMILLCRQGVSLEQIVLALLAGTKEEIQAIREKLDVS